MVKVRGVWSTIRHMGLRYTVREAIRRVFHIPYEYRGIPVKDTATFRILKFASKHGSVWLEGGEVFFRNKLGTFAVSINDLNLLRALGEDFEEMYGYLDVKGKVVADVGAFLGETAVMFAKMGARHVHAYEPVYFKYVEHNLKLNGVDNATVHPYGLFIEEDVIYVAEHGTATGLTYGGLEVRVKPLGDAITDVVKLDCEGCEWALLSLPCSVIRRAEEYAVEIHGPEPPLVRKMEKCGYLARRIAELTDLVYVWHFKR